MEKKNIIRISNALNLTRQEFSIIEKHLFVFSLLNLKEQQGFKINIENELEAVRIEFPSSELKETNRERIKEALDKITSRKIYFEKSTEYFGYVVPFISAKYESKDRAYSTIIIKLNPDCKKLFYELANGYTTTDLKAILNLKSMYSIRMYELMSMYISQRKWTTELDDLKNLLNLELTKYKSFSQFENKVLLYSQKELWEHCNLYFEWEIAAKKGKKITALTFHIKEREKQERIELAEEIKATQNFIATLTPADIAQKSYLLTQSYALTKKQVDYIMTNTNVFNDFVRIDIIIEDMIAKGKPPKDRTKYLAKSLGLDKIKFTKKRNNDLFH
jgi:plasmid replication initiation protein